MTWLTAGTVVTGTRVLRPGWVEVLGDRVVAVGPEIANRPGDEVVPPGIETVSRPRDEVISRGLGIANRPDEVTPGPVIRNQNLSNGLVDDVIDLGTDAIVVPGFVDLHVHGGGGFAYTSHVAADVRAAARFHLAHGTTTTLASLVTAAEPDLLQSVQVLADLVDDGILAGVHLEGPWLSRERKGAHQESLLRPPDVAELQRLLVAGRGAVRMVTIAPELDGALDLIGAVADAGVVAAVGHTEADHATTRAAIAAGARVGTHLFNAMRPIHHREPGPIVALLDDDRVVVEMIADGVHQHPALLDHVMRTAGPDRVALVTDAMAAAGCADGAYSLGPLDVTVRGGLARLTGGDSIAGSTASADVLFRAAAGGRTDADMLNAVRMSARTPATVLGREDIGHLEPGARADLVVLDGKLVVQQVLRGGSFTNS